MKELVMPDNFDALVSRLLERRPNDNKPDEVTKKLSAAKCFTFSDFTFLISVVWEYFTALLMYEQ
jgi:hypothetical protein